MDFLRKTRFYRYSSKTPRKSQSQRDFAIHSLGVSVEHYLHAILFLERGLGFYLSHLRICANLGIRSIYSYLLGSQVSRVQSACLTSLNPRSEGTIPCEDDNSRDCSGGRTSIMRNSDAPYIPIFLFQLDIISVQIDHANFRKSLHSAYPHNELDIKYNEQSMLAESVNALPIYYPTRRVIVKALASCHALSDGKLIFCQGWL